MKPDTITVRVVKETEIDADSADLTIVVEGSSVFSGSEAFKKAKELRSLIDALKDVGLEESRVKLRSVEVNSQSFAIIKTSSARYIVTVKNVAVEMLPQVLGVVSSHKGAKLNRLNWNYERLKSTRKQLRREALIEALAQARADVIELGVAILGVHELKESSQSSEYNPESITGNLADGMAFRGGSSQDIGFHLGNSTTARVDLIAEFRVSPIAAES